MSSYDKVQTGMSQSEVESILGKGKEQGSSDMSVPGMSTSVKILAWQEGMKIISVTFQDGKVMGKSQSGL